jgi:hypothetical protein
MTFHMLTCGRSACPDSNSAEVGALKEFLCGGTVAALLSSVCRGIVPPFLIIDMMEVDIVERRSFVTTLEASERESSGMRGRPSCDGGIDGE